MKKIIDGVNIQSALTSLVIIQDLIERNNVLKQKGQEIYKLTPELELKEGMDIKEINVYLQNYIKEYFNSEIEQKINYLTYDYNSEYDCYTDENLLKCYDILNKAIEKINEVLDKKYKITVSPLAEKVEIYFDNYDEAYDFAMATYYTCLVYEYTDGKWICNEAQ